KLAANVAALGAEHRDFTETSGVEVATFRELYESPDPPLKLLELTKLFAKANQDVPESPIPRQIAVVLYYLSIAAALTRCGKRITSLSDAALEKGFKWALRQQWVVGRPAEMLPSALRAIQRR